MRQLRAALTMLAVLFGAAACAGGGTSSAPHALPSPLASAPPPAGAAKTFVYARGAVDIYTSGSYGARPVGQILSADLGNGSNAHQGIAVDALGTLYASVLASDGLTYVDAFASGAGGQTLPVDRLPFGAPAGLQPQLAVDAANALYVLASGQIRIYSRDTGPGTARAIGTLSLHKPAQSIAVGSDGKMYVAGTEDCSNGPAPSYIDIFAPMAQGGGLLGEIEGVATGINTASANSCATLDALAVDPSGNVYVVLTDIGSNPNDGAVVSFAAHQFGNTAGTPLRIPGLKAREVAVDASGHLLVGGSQAGGEVDVFASGTGLGVYGDRNDATAIVAPAWGVAVSH